MRRKEAYLVLPSYVQGLCARRKQEGVREHSVSIHFGIVMIHVVPETENMTSEHTKFTSSFLMNRRLQITAVSSKK